MRRSSASCALLIMFFKPSMKGWNREITLLYSSPCDSHLYVAALNNFIFFNSSELWAAAKKEDFFDEYFIAFQIANRLASTSLKFLNFGMRWTNTRASRWFLQLTYLECGALCFSLRWRPFISPLIVLVPSNLWNRSSHFSALFN